MRKRLTMLGALLVLTCAASIAGMQSARPVHATGTCAGSIGMSPEINPGWDYLAIKLTATGVTGCTAPLYQFAFFDWDTSTRTIFRDYTSSSTAYWDTRNFTGTWYISIYVKDATSASEYDVYSPWLSYDLYSHGYGNVFDPYITGLYLQNLDSQGDPETTIGPDPLTGQPRLTKWLSTYITLEGGSNHTNPV